MLTEIFGGMLGIIIIGLVIFIVLMLIIKGFCLIGANQVGILTKNMFGKKMPEGQIIARHGEIGVQAQDFDARALLEAACHLVIYQSSGSDGRY